MIPGRSCPLHYHYEPADLARSSVLETDCLYVIGGLYGNLAALDAILEMAAREPRSPVLIFNGDFNWFNIDRSGFEEINCRVLAHVALRGNVETELAGDDDGFGCGCGYPEFVSDAEVERSNRIIERLRETARGFPELRSRLSALPMYISVKVGGTRVAIVHGDCESLAGWGLSQEALVADAQRARVQQWFAQARASVIASSHSCLPVMMDFETAQGPAVVINNGAAGMPNFRATHYGVITRIATQTVNYTPTLYGIHVANIRVDALAVNYDHARWERDFLANWPAGSAANASYYDRTVRGPRYDLDQAVRLIKGKASVRQN